MTTRPNEMDGGDRTLAAIAAAGGGVVLVALGFALWRNYQVAADHSLLVQARTAVSASLPALWRSRLGQEAQTMGLPLAGDTKAYWYMARAGGIVSYLLLWLATCWGIMMSSKFIKGVVDAPVAYALHEYLPMVGVVFAAVHAAVLLGDSYIGFKPWQLLVPFTSPYEPGWTALGTLAFYLFVALIASHFLRKRIGQKAWRAFHYTSYLAFLMALVHGLMAGSDSSALAIKAMYLLTGASSLFLLYYRLLAYSPRARRAAARRAPESAD